MKNRPHINGTVCVSPSDASMMAVFGGETFEGIAVTRGQMAAMSKLYGFDVNKSIAEAQEFATTAYNSALEKYNSEMDKYAEGQGYYSREQVRPKLPDLTGISALQRATSNRDTFRCASEDGVRMVAAIAKYLTPGEDPTRALVRLMGDAGWDVGWCAEWAYGEEDEEEMVEGDGEDSINDEEATP